MRQQALKPADTTSREFRAWFGRPKVVNPDGSPMVVYHGTSGAYERGKSFEEFDTSHGLGTHFGTAEQADVALHKLISNRRIYPVYLSIQNPLRLPDLVEWGQTQIVKRLARQKGFHGALSVIPVPYDYADIREYIQAKGYDGIIYLNRFEAINKDESFSTPRSVRERGSDKVFKEHCPSARDSWIAFYPEQIKSVFNRGTWSKTDPNILNPGGGSMKLIQTFSQPISGYWDGGPKQRFTWEVDYSRQGHDSKGTFVRVGSYEANHYFNVSLGKTERATLNNARLHLAAIARVHGLPCTFEITE